MNVTLTGGAPWGFRLFGGESFPIEVAKVTACKLGFFLQTRCIVHGTVVCCICFCRYLLYINQLYTIMYILKKPWVYKPKNPLLSFQCLMTQCCHFGASMAAFACNQTKGIALSGVYIDIMHHRQHCIIVRWYSVISGMTDNLSAGDVQMLRLILLRFKCLHIVCFNKSSAEYMQLRIIQFDCKSYIHSSFGNNSDTFGTLAIVIKLKYVIYKQNVERGKKSVFRQFYSLLLQVFLYNQCSYRYREFLTDRDCFHSDLQSLNKVIGSFKDHKMRQSLD